MRDYLRGVKKFPIRIMPVTVCVMILFACLSLYSANFNRNETGQQVEILERERGNLEWSIIENNINVSYDLAKRDAKVLSLEVERELNAHYPDLLDLKNEFDTKQYSKEFNSILQSILYDSDQDLTLVGTKDHLITMFANNNDHMFKKVSTDGIISWKKLSKETPNPKLTNKAIDALISKNNGIIFTLNRPTSSGFSENLNALNMDTLKSIYMKEGIQGLYSITLFAAAYITEDGDIFGTEDKTFLKSNDNHKLIIVKTVKLQDVIMEDRDVMGSALHTMYSITELTKMQGERNVYQSVIWCVFSFMISLYLIFVYNNEESRGLLGVRKEDKLDDEGGKSDKMRGE